MSSMNDFIIGATTLSPTEDFIRGTLILTVLLALFALHFYVGYRIYRRVVKDLRSIFVAHVFAPEVPLNNTKFDGPSRPRFEGLFFR